MKKLLIVNADDLGLSPSVNYGIMASHQDGIVTSTTLLANGNAFDDAVQRIKSAETLGIGIHLNILRGSPVSQAQKLPKLVKNGFFHSNIFTLSLGLDKKMLDEAEREYRAQIEKVLQAGLKITHLDSEKHHHTIPYLFDLTMKLAGDYKIPGVRLCRERIWTGNIAKLLKMLPVYFFAERNYRKVQTSQLKFTTYQKGVAMTGSMNSARLMGLLTTLPEGATELCVHPGYVDEQHKRDVSDFGSFYIDGQRERELALLCSAQIKKIIRETHIELIHYGEL